jgi:glycosyltransferase involved in cell wall biosynthesis
MGWIPEPDDGQAAAINKGFRLSLGKVMAWVNSDDGYAPKTLGRIGRFFGHGPAGRIVSGFRRNVSASNHGGVRVYAEPDANSLSRCCYVAQEAPFWTRTVWDTVGGLDESYRFALDYDFWQRILRTGFRFDLLPMYAGRFRLHPASKGSRWTELRTEEHRRIYSTYLGATKSERELWAEISAEWWRRVRLLHRLAHRGILDHLGIAKVIVGLLSLNEARIPNFAGERVAFGFE